MEFFDFEQAAHEDYVAYDCPAIDESDIVAQYDSLVFYKDLGLPTGASAVQTDEAKGKNEPFISLFDKGVFPVTRATEPCDLCRARGLDCFMAKRGVMRNNGCTCCISLYRECSFTRTKPHEKGLDTLHVVSEDSYVPVGGFTGKKALRSFKGGAGGSAFEDTDSKRRKTGARFSREALRALKTWLTENAGHPYPTDEEKDELKTKTGLKRSQICNWLANARRRGKVRPSLRASSPRSTGPIDIPRKQLAPGVDIADLTPLERWKHSPPEHEPASATAIIRAMANAPYIPERNSSSGSRVRSHSRNTGSSNDGSSFSNLMPAPSVSSYSFETTKSSTSDMSFASAFSHRSSRSSFNSADSKERRRRRHRSVVGQNTFQKARAARIFQCTFCADSFTTKYDWQRHEKSLHLALDKWTCTPQGGAISLNGAIVCAFCKGTNPDIDHLEAHNFIACQEKSIHERTFYRKDHLTQHLRLMHSVKFSSWMENWKSATTEIKSRCGFCSSTFTTWKDRVEHLSAHFKAGTDMSQWKGDWGFEPFVQRLVENSIPPFLIAQERNTLNPWVAKPAATKCSHVAERIASYPASISDSSNIPIPEDANCFRRLQIQLAAYISREVARGIIPTDSELQNEARKVVYGCDDPWNQTCADNPIWLSILKRDSGLCDSPEVENIHLDDLGMQPPFAAPGLSQPPRHKLMAISSNLSNSGFDSSGIYSPAFDSNGFSSGAPSVHGSFAGSATGSVGVSSTRIDGGWPCLTTSYTISSSAPVTVRFNPTAHIGTDSQYRQYPSDSVDGDLGANFDDMHIDTFEPGGTTITAKVGAMNSSGHLSFKMPSSVAIDVPAPALSVSGTHIVSGSYEHCFRNIFDDHFDMN
ncbi:hypothetical protein PABG_11528 [Paracoccidioides brasiliensis Pb03]|nr:hypothetical protein PABG_11528 [Paracoccidioides brasiliensis Pb03]